MYDHYSMCNHTRGTEAGAAKGKKGCSLKAGPQEWVLVTEAQWEEGTTQETSGISFPPSPSSAAPRTAIHMSPSPGVTMALVAQPPEWPSLHLSEMSPLLSSCLSSRASFPLLFFQQVVIKYLLRARHRANAGMEWQSEEGG